MKTYTVEIDGVLMEIRRDTDGKFLIPDGWRGLGSALKPANEPICVGRKPIEGTIADNVLKWGVGALNIDGCRVPTDENPSGVRRAGKPPEREAGVWSNDRRSAETFAAERAGEIAGRWPANLMHDNSPEVVAMFPDSDGQQADLKGDEPSRPALNVYGEYKDRWQFEARNDSGSAARFFWSSKAAADDRLGSKHPTVKPIDLMQELVRLVTPKGGTVLDPFSGTGTTGEAAWREGMKAILIEREPEYQADIARRMQLATQPTKRAAVAKSKNQLDRPEDMPLFNVGEPK